MLQPNIHKAQEDCDNLSYFEKTINYAQLARINSDITNKEKKKEMTTSISYVRNVGVMVADLCHAMPTAYHANGIILFDILLEKHLQLIAGRSNDRFG